MGRARLESPQAIVKDAMHDGVSGFVCGGNMNTAKASLWTALQKGKEWMDSFQHDPQFVCSTNKAANDSSLQKHHGDVAFACNVDLMQVDCAVTNIDRDHEIVIAAWMRPTTVSNEQQEEKKDAEMEAVQSEQHSRQVLQSTEASNHDIGQWELRLKRFIKDDRQKIKRLRSGSWNLRLPNF